MAISINDYNLGNYIVPHEIKNGICVDVGTNLGHFTEKYKDFFGKIYFIEPQLMLFEHLTKKFENEKNIIGYNMGVWSESDIDLDMVWHSNNDLGSIAVKGDFINDDWTNNLVNKVKSISIDKIYNIIGENNIDYLKVDCETSEYPFLYGKDLSKINYISVEFHHHMGANRYNELLNWITKTHDLIHGVVDYVLGENKEVLFKLR